MDLLWTIGAVEVMSGLKKYFSVIPVYVMFH